MNKRLPKAWVKTRSNGRKQWYVTTVCDGKQKQVYLAEYGVSDDELQKLLLAALQEHGIRKGTANPTFVDIVTAHLEHVRSDLSAKTFEIRSSFLTKFLEYLAGNGLSAIAAKNLKPFHVTKWLTASGWTNPNTRSMAVKAIKTATNWAFREGLIDDRPLLRLKTPSERPRGDEILLSPTQLQHLMDATECDQHRDLLIGLFGSGCRPGEIASLTAENVRLDRGQWMVNGKTGERAVALTQTLVELTKRLLVEHPTGFLFRTANGTPLTARSIRVIIHRLRDRLREKGVTLPKRVCGYSARHYFVRQLLAAGAQLFDVSRLVGHTSTQITAKHYSHHDVQTAARALDLLPK